MIDGWSPVGRVGQPLAWVTVATYLAASGLAHLAAARAEEVRTSKSLHRDSPGSRRAWARIAVVLLVLAVDAQVDLLGLATAAIRDFAVTQGWYAQRREAQAAMLLLVLAVGIAVGGTLLVRHRHLMRRWQRNAPMLLARSAMVVLLVFLIVRAISFHAVDAMLGARLLGLRVSRIVELGCIASIALAAVTSMAVRTRTRRFD